MLTLDRLKELLVYDPCTGIFHWKNGKEAGTLDRGYIKITIDRKIYRAHKLAWLYIYGEWPKSLLDHKDRIRNHNWISNLREATETLNAINSKPYKSNTSGFQGITKQGTNFRAEIRIGKKKKHLGMYKTKEEAFAVYWQIRLDVYREFVPKWA